MNTAKMFELSAYESANGYCRPNDNHLAAVGGQKLQSSNWDHNGQSITSGYSFSPTDLWEFKDGSRLEVAYSGCYSA